MKRILIWPAASLANLSSSVEVIYGGYYETLHVDAARVRQVRMEKWGIDIPPLWLRSLPNLEAFWCPQLLRLRQEFGYFAMLPQLRVLDITFEWRAENNVSDFSPLRALARVEELSLHNKISVLILARAMHTSSKNFVVT